VTSHLDLPLEIKSGYEAAGVLTASHGVAGNRVRRTGAKKLKLDDQWKSALKKRWAKMTILCWPFMKRYGY
jgi:hypothetical protein